MGIFNTETEREAGKTSGWKISVLIYMVVWTVCVLWFWFGRGGGGWIMAYTILSFGVILPVTTLAAAFLLEWKQSLGHWRWAAMGFFSVLYTAALWATFALSSFLWATNITVPSPYTLLAGLCASAVGIAFGWLVRSRNMSLKVPVIGLFLLLLVCYVILKTLNGTFFRIVLILDMPAVLLLILGLGILFQRHEKKQAGKKGK